MHTEVMFARSRDLRPIVRSAPVVFFLALIAPACGPSTNPSADAARTALATALDAWRDGKKPADLIRDRRQKFLDMGSKSLAA